MTVRIFSTREELEQWLADHDVPEDIAHAALKEWDRVARRRSR